ncbi:exodeoxyribonuclease VII large subunit [Colwellia sp. 1_MG-2023]|uniref:exodeoxyribonuclease VII large subunit n=1 Tax=unclassified Colwellia TaxID=196834 RepID=UPI001C095512|nr:MULTISPECIES: exodeoxyribonuclease VII large subunit [unclassified Colwellia]MBU2924238.1 exodeoxyribonuclease VII large subunit [Colwellia sp. C2M11]MDO6652101.1 exodeoxyribonuclease VII large subunit [Colwellia sp. 3_MG-2023]MDO6664877.1 exodeoxyribonuclease VII large subunit [Colwellia sp. 2_MG-2023]MDO6689081.1 exodeoxyribonuclease VII large subunit [Colwellia sp. 1_MG-2023]
MPAQHILQVSELTRKVRFILESELNTVWLTGEISNFVAASSGHWYLSLKDNKSQVRCAMFKGNNQRVRLANNAKPRNGQQVLVRAKVSLYEPRGDFQLIIEQLDDAGEGLLRQQYEQLKNKLNALGIFSQAHKQQIPTTIQRVGIVTSPTGAAVKDILTVLKRRNPNIQVTIYPALVQGQYASNDICHAIAQANSRQECDVLIVGRGGGSLEDLWPFNEEIVVQAIYDSVIPTISAVGHEVDTTLSDYVADLRAPTPSAAAELVSSDSDELMKKITMLTLRLNNAITRNNNVLIQKLSHTQHRLTQAHPEQQLRIHQQKSDELNLRLTQVIKRILLQTKQQPQQLAQRLNRLSPNRKLVEYQTIVTQLKQRLINAQQNNVQHKSELFVHLIEQLQLVSPLATIARGYGVVRDTEDKVISSVKQISVNNEISVQISDGIIKAKVIEGKS